MTNTCLNDKQYSVFKRLFIKSLNDGKTAINVVGFGENRSKKFLSPIGKKRKVMATFKRHDDYGTKESCYAARENSCICKLHCLVQPLIHS